MMSHNKKLAALCGALAAEVDDLRAEKAELIAALERLRKASQEVMDGLCARIDAADPCSVPVYAGIADLHDELGRTRAALSKALSQEVGK